MAAEENRIQNLRKLVDAEAEANGGKLRFGYRAISTATGLGEEYIYQLYKGIKTTVGLDAAKVISRAYLNGRTTDWFDLPPGATTATERHSVGGSVIALHGEDHLPDGYIQIKESQVRFAAGNGHNPTFDELTTSVPATYRLEWFQRERINPAHCKRFKVDGDSMQRTLFNKDTVLVNLGEKIIVDGRVYAIRYGEELRIKRLYKRLDGGLILHSDNPDHHPRDEELSPEVVVEHISIIGRVRDKSGAGGL